MVRKLGGAKQVAAVQPSAAAATASAPVPRSWVGLNIQDVTPELATAFNLAEAGGALVAAIAKGGPAEKAGIQAGDVIVAFLGQPVQKAADLPPLVTAHPPDTRVNVRVIRQGQAKDLSVMLEKLPEAKAPQAAGKTESDLGSFFARFSGGVLFSQIKQPYQQQLLARGFQLQPNARIGRVIRQGVMTEVKSAGDM